MFSTKSQLILAQLLNFQRFSSVLSTESSHLIEENKSMSVLFSVWLSDIKQRIQSAKKTKNKKNQLTLKLFEPTYNHNPPETFPEPKTVPNVNKEELQKIIEDLLQSRKRNALKRRLCYSVENEFCITKNSELSSKQKKENVQDSPHKMDIIPEQPSREEKDEPQSQQQALTPTFTSIVQNNNIPLKNQTNNFNNEFTFFKAKKEQTTSTKEVKPTIISTSKKKGNIPLFNTDMKIQSTLTKNYVDTEYEITEGSESSDEESEDDSKIKKIPKWAKNKKYIEECVIKQTKEGLYMDIFGKCKIDNLNLNMIFYTMDDKYQCRNSTADWRLDNTIKSLSKNNTQNKNISTFKVTNSEHNKIFPKTNRQLNFSNSKNIN